jgi:hypothetical protein
MESPLADRPKVVFWFRVYAAFMAAIYGLVAVAGIVLMALSPSLDDPVLMILAPVYIVLGLVFGLAYALAFAFKPSPLSWVYDIVLICIGFGGCPTVAAAIPLLIFWIRPETRRYFGRE